MGSDLLRRRAWLPLVVVLGVAALAGCGDSDDGDGGSNGGAAASQPADTQPGGAAKPAKGGSDEEQIRAVYATLREAFYGDDPKGVCATMTESAQKRFGAISPPAVTCVERAARVNAANSTGRDGDDRPDIVAMRIRGDRAIAQAKTPRTLSYPVPFARVNGEWKVDGGFGAPGG